jgi:hypothetical protein
MQPMMRMPTPPTGVPVGSYETYEAAQRAVDFLSDEQFPVQHVTIVGNGLRMVERVTGRWDRNRAAGTGAAGGAWWGLFLGLMLSLFSDETSSSFLVLLAATIAGGVFGAVFGMIGYSMTGGHRDFRSQSSVVATTYDLLCQYQHADQARVLLEKLAMRR